MSASSPSPGWYPDPADGAARWWDGRAWTAYRGAPAPVGVVQPPLPADVSTGTPWIWIQAVLPLAQVLAQLPYLLSFRGLITAQFVLMGRAPGARLTAPEAQALFAQYGSVFGALAVTGGLSLLFSAAWVLLAVADQRRLAALGIVQPFHWAWAFLGLVYPIGRAVVLHRRIHRGLGPLWLLIGSTVGGWVLGVVLQFVVLLPVFTSMSEIARSNAGACGC